MSWQNSIFLDNSEKVIQSWKGDCERFFQTVVSEDGFLKKNYVAVDAKRRTSGVLVLTNRRLVWLEKRGVLIFASYHSAFEIDLSSLRGVSYGGIFEVWVSIADAKKEVRFHLVGVGKRNIDSFRNLIFKQAKEIREKSNFEKSKPKKVIVKEIVMLPCQYCRALMPQTAIFCPHCGARRTG